MNERHVLVIYNKDGNIRHNAYLKFITEVFPLGLYYGFSQCKIYKNYDEALKDKTKIRESLNPENISDSKFFEQLTISSYEKECSAWANAGLDFEESCKEIKI